MSEVARLQFPDVVFAEGIKDIPEVRTALDLLDRAFDALSALDGVSIEGEPSWEDTA